MIGWHHIKQNVGCFKAQFRVSQSLPSANLSTGPPRPPMPAGRVSWLLLVSVSRKSDNRVQRDPVGVSALLSMAAKLSVVAGRDLHERSKGEQNQWKIFRHVGEIHFALKRCFGFETGCMACKTTGCTGWKNSQNLCELWWVIVEFLRFFISLLMKACTLLGVTVGSPLKRPCWAEYPHTPPQEPLLFVQAALVNKNEFFHCSSGEIKVK